VTQRRAGRTAFAAVGVVSLVMLFAPASHVPSGFEVSDKLVHFLLFAALAVTGRAAGLPAVPLAAGLAAYAGISEVLQTILPIDRNGDPRDALADLLGALSGLVGVGLARRNRRVGT
jgi:VanZ family protein